MGKGLKGVPTLSAKEIAKKHGVSLGHITKQIAAGVKVEKEHTKSTKEANEIARDHLAERPDYYIKLHKMEKTKVIKELGEYDNKGGSLVVGDLTGSSRKAARVDELKIPSKVKKAVATGMTLANLGTLAQVAGDATEGRKGADPKRGMVAAASALPGAVGWGATGLNYTIKGFDKAREHLRGKKMKEDKDPCWKGYEMIGMKKKNGRKVPNCVPKEEKDIVPANSTERGIYEISAELVGKVSNARFWQGKAPSKTLTRAINKKFIESGKKDKGKINKETVKEETMDTKDQIQEAIGNIMEDNLVEMKENFLAVLQEKAMEKLEERKKEIAANYFAQ